MEMTTEQKRDLLERIETLIKYDVLKLEDRNDIFRVCLAACSRAIAEMKEGGHECS